MTNREQLARKKTRYFFAFTGGALFGVLSAQATYFFVPGWPIHLALLFAVVAAGGWLGYTFLVRCPRCNGNIGGKYNHFGTRSFLLYRPVAHCPFCGVSLDERVGA